METNKMSAEELEGTELGSEDENQEEEEEKEDQSVESKPLTKELAGESLSLLCKTGSGLAHAYVRMDVKDKGLTDIGILGNFKHVRYVDISGNALEDISCLAELPHLLTINADHNRLTTANLPELQYLQIASFADNRITSVEGIAHPMLESLNLASNQIASLTGLNNSNLPCLRILDLHGNQLESITTLQLPTLQKLYLAANKLTCCDGIQGLHQLTTLHLRDNPIATLDGFAPSMAALQYLNLRSAAIEESSELTKLKCLPMLRALVLTANPLCEAEEYRVEVCILLRKLERLDKDEFSEDERADAEELQQQRLQEDNSGEN